MFINYNIINIIMYKKAFMEWKYRIQNIHKELDKEYNITVRKDDSFEETFNFNENYDGEFCYIYNMSTNNCKNCIVPLYIMMIYNNRDIEYLSKKRIKDNDSDYIYTKFKPLCYMCRQLASLPKNYL